MNFHLKNKYNKVTIYLIVPYKRQGYFREFKYLCKGILVRKMLKPQQGILLLIVQIDIHNYHNDILAKRNK